ncbi:hypothetical protein V8D89_011772 [Ganoderma adspersum]
MFADALIAEVLADLRRHSPEMLTIVPKFRDISIGEVHLGMDCCHSACEVVKEIGAAPGVYPVVWPVKLEPRDHRQQPGASGDPPSVQPDNAKNQSEAGRTGRLRSTQAFEDFIRDEEASISLWTIPLDHACVPRSERCGKAQDSDEDEELQTASNHSEHARAHHDSEDVWASKAIRVALDFTTSEGRPIRRTGIVLLRGQKPTRQSDSCGFEGLGAMGWSVRWDYWQSFAGTQVSLIVPTSGMPLSCLDPGSGSSSDPIQVQDAESRFVVLVWKEKVPNPNMEGSGGADGSIVTMIFKKQDGGLCQPVQFTKEEKQAFGIGLSEEDGFGINTVQ